MPIFAGLNYECAMTLLFTILAVAAAVALLCVRILLKKDGRFSSQHIAENSLMRKRGITCATSQDRNARTKNERKINVKQL